MIICQSYVFLHLMDTCVAECKLLHGIIISVPPDAELDNFITFSPEIGATFLRGDAVTVSLIVSPDSPEVDTITISGHGSAIGPLTQTCPNVRSCPLDLSLVNVGEANFNAQIYYGCTTLSRQLIITAVETGKVACLMSFLLA